MTRNPRTTCLPLTAGVALGSLLLGCGGGAGRASTTSSAAHADAQSVLTYAEGVEPPDAMRPALSQVYAESARPARVLHLLARGERAVVVVDENPSDPHSEVALLEAVREHDQWSARRASYAVPLSVLASQNGLEEHPADRIVELLAERRLSRLEGSGLTIELAESVDLNTGEPGTQTSTSIDLLLEDRSSTFPCRGRVFTGTSGVAVALRLEVCMPEGDAPWTARLVLLDPEGPSTTDPSRGNRERRIEGDGTLRFTQDDEPSRGTGWRVVGSVELPGEHNLMHIAQVPSLSGTRPHVVARAAGAVKLVQLDP